MDKITKEELDSINNIIDKFQKLIYKLGDIDYNIEEHNKVVNEFKNERNIILNEINILKIEEEKLDNILKTKYPGKDIDISNGNINN